MKPTSGIINTARAQLIDEEAMERALREKRLAFAALDVFAVEPPGPEHQLLGLENVILTPTWHHGRLRPCTGRCGELWIRSLPFAGAQRSQA